MSANNATAVNAKITSWFRARNTLMLVRTDDELRVERALIQAAASAKFEMRFWDCDRGITGADDSSISKDGDPVACLNFIRTRKDRVVYVLRDLHKWLGQPDLPRKLRNLSRELQVAPPNEARSILLLAPMAMEIPRDIPELKSVDYPLPDRAEVSRLLDDVLAALPESIRVDAAPNGTRERAVDAALGLSALNISNSYSVSLVTNRKVDPALVTSEKKTLIAGMPGITWHEPDPRGLDAIGGYDELKQWCLQRKAAFTQEARDFGLPAPKGAMLVGLPGCLAAGTKISYKRGKRTTGRSLPIEVFCEKFNGARRVVGLGRAGAGAAWDPELPTYIQSWNPETGHIVYNEVTSVIATGVKSCIRLVTDKAGEVELTPNHPVLLARGHFCAAGEIKVGERIVVRGSMTPIASGRRKFINRERVVVEGLKYHPHAWRKVVVDQGTGKRYEYGRTHKARLVLEARMNRVSLDEFIKILKEDQERAEQMVFISPEYDVHHVDEDPSNDSIDNLMIHTHEEHAQLHGAENAVNFNIEHTTVATVTAVMQLGERRTYDITMTQEIENFVVNDGIIVHNTGKSLAAKCIATVFGIPLLRGDLGGAKSKYVGDSEQNIRRLIQLAETMAPCVLWFDEIEKALAGASGPQGDGGVSTDALGVILSWMQEKTASVFVIATANDVRQLPPELLRKGRFDEMFFVDLPQHGERVEIVAASLKAFNRPTDGIDLGAVADTTDGFVGAEIAALVPDALYAAFADGKRPITTEDLKTAAARVVPLSKTASEKISQLREWAKGRARPASTPEKPAEGAVRSLDL